MHLEVAVIIPEWDLDLYSIAGAIMVLIAGPVSLPIVLLFEY